MVDKIKTLELIEGKNLNLGVINDKAYANVLYNSLELATKDKNGLMSKEDKAKLDNTDNIIDKNNTLGSFTIKNNKISATKKNDVFSIISDNNIKLTANNSNKSITIDLLPLDESGYSDRYLSKENKIKLDSINVKAEENQLAFSKISTENGILTAKYKDDKLDIITDENIEIVPSQSLKRLTISSKIPLVTIDNNGLMSREDKIRLDKIQNNSEVNQNAFSIVNINGNRLEAKSKNDILRFTSGKDIILTGAEHSNAIKIESSLTNATENKDGLISQIDKVKIDEIEVGSEKNQNAFEKIIVNARELIANNKNDTYELEGKDGITIISNIAKKSIEIGINLNAKDGINKIVNNSTGLITLEGLSSSNDNTFSDFYKTKLDGIESNAEVNQNAFTKVFTNNEELLATKDNDTLFIDAELGNSGEISTENNKIKIKSRAEKNKRFFKSIIVNNTKEDATEKNDILSFSKLSDNDTRYDIIFDDSNNSIEIKTKVEENQNAFNSLSINEKLLQLMEKSDGITFVPNPEIIMTGDPERKEINFSLKTNSVDKNINLINDIIVEGMDLKDRKKVKRKFSEFVNNVSNKLNIVGDNGYNIVEGINGTIIEESCSSGVFNYVAKLPTRLTPKSFYLLDVSKKLYFGDYYYNTIEVHTNSGNKNVTSAKNLYGNIFEVIEIMNPILNKEGFTYTNPTDITIPSLYRNRCFYDTEKDCIILNDFQNILKISNFYISTPTVEILSPGLDKDNNYRTDLFYMEDANLYICRVGFNNKDFTKKNYIQASRDLVNWVTIYGDDINCRIFAICKGKEGDNLFFMEAEVEGNNDSSLFTIHFNGNNDNSPIVRSDFVIKQLDKYYDYSSNNDPYYKSNLTLIYLNNNLFRVFNYNGLEVERLYINVSDNANGDTKKICSIDSSKSASRKIFNTNGFIKAIPNMDFNQIKIYGKDFCTYIKCGEGEYVPDDEKQIKITDYQFPVDQDKCNFMLYNDVTKMPAIEFTSINNGDYIEPRAYSYVDVHNFEDMVIKRNKKFLFENLFEFLEIQFFNHQVMYFFTFEGRYFLLRPKNIYF